MNIQDLGQLFISAKEFIGRIFAVEKARIFILTDDKKRFWSLEIGEDGVEKKVYFPRAGIVGQCLKENEIVSISNPLDDGVYNELSDINTTLP